MEHAPAALGAVWPYLQALEASGLGATARQSLWLYPIASIVHILGLALLVGGIIAFDLRVLGAVPAVPVHAAARLLLPLARVGFVLQVASGAVMLAADATHLGANPAFQLKMVLVLAALLNLVLFHTLAGRAMVRLEARPGGTLRVLAALSLTLWVSVATLGRFAAYV